MVDEDINEMTRDELAAEVVRLRTAIREHRDSSGQDLCWYHPDLWATLPEEEAGQIVVPPWPEFLRGCVAYRTSLENPEAPGSPTS